MPNDCRLYRLLHALIVIGLFGMLLSRPQLAYASLSPEDHDDLTESLLILSTGWVQEHVDRANSILSKAEYTSADWHEFFSEYFSTNPFTDHLRNYLGYPVFWWFDDDVHLKLQTGLVLPLETKIQDIVAVHAADLGSALETDTNLRQTLFNSHRFFNHMFNVGVIAEGTRTEIYNFYSGHVGTYPLLWKSTVTIDTSSQRYVAAVRAQIYMNLGDALPLVPARKADISQTIELSGTYATLWTDYTVLLIDNNGLDQTQLDVVRAYLAVLPTGIHDLRYITVNSLLGNEGTHYEWLANSTGVNIFDTSVGTWTGNSFPDDVSPVYTDAFSLVLAHEVNHRVDATFTRTDPHLAQRRDDLIAAAGPDHMNYLRSMFEDGFFVNAPQEFFASISNQWFADTAHTLELGLVRWNNGYSHPINQFLFFAEVYSQGGNTVQFYTMDEEAHISRTDIPVLRDIYGHICTLTVDGNTYRLLLNSEGDVLHLLTHTVYLPLLRK
jgi:hypothetical protein